MIDFGFDKLALIGAVALIVIGPEKLPRVARTVGHFVGKAQRYVADVKAEVNRSIELEELRKMKSSFEDAARDVEHSVSKEMHQTSSDLNSAWSGSSASAGSGSSVSTSAADPLADPSIDPWAPPVPAPAPAAYTAPKKNWRLKRSAVPQWYKQRQGLRTRAQSGAARVARFRPPRSGA